MRTLVIACLGASILHGFCPGLAAAAPDVAANPSDSIPAMPTIQLPTIKPMPADDGPEGQHHIASAKAAEAQARLVDHPIRRSELLSYAASLVLGFELEPACTSKMLRLTNERSASELNAALDNADRLLADAKIALEKARDDQAGSPGELATAQHAQANVSAFANVIRAYLLPPEKADEESRKTAKRAASGLSVLLEDENVKVVASATLWQAAVRMETGDTRRAKALLDMPLSSLARQSVPYAFYGRLLSCQLLADSGGYAAALALLAQMEERCHDWFSSPDMRANAERTITVVKIDVLRQWYESLDAEGASARSWCRDRITSLVDDRLSVDQPTLLRLTPAIPVIEPAIDVAPNETESESATLNDPSD